VTANAPAAAPFRHTGPVRALVAGLVLLAAGAGTVSAGDIDGCLASLREDALGAGVRPATFRRLTRGLQADMEVLARLDAQPELARPVQDYLAAVVSEERVASGRRMLARWRRTLATIDERFGVDAETVVAVWGVESFYGRRQGKRPLVRSLVTLSCYGRRQAFFRGELVALMRLVDGGEVASRGLRGSWAGAFGQTQFMPSTYQRLAVDLDGDGRRDLVHSVPDALASTANFLARSGWRRGETWGYEVSVPADFDGSLAGRGSRRALEEWAGLGVRPPGPRPLLAAPPAALLLPGGLGGPAFLVFPNFDALFAYNNADSYGLAIALLADRLRGASAPATLTVSKAGSSGAQFADRHEEAPACSAARVLCGGPALDRRRGGTDRRDPGVRRRAGRAGNRRTGFLEVEVGVGFGLTSASDPLTFKLILSRSLNAR